MTTKRISCDGRVLLEWVPVVCAAPPHVLDQVLLKSECWHIMKFWRDPEHGNVLHTLLADGCIDEVRSFRYPTWFADIMSDVVANQTLLDEFICLAPWNEVEYSCCGCTDIDLWRDHVAIMRMLYKLNVPMTPMGKDFWTESYNNRIICPASWHGVIGLALHMDASTFKPFTWGANDLFCGCREYCVERWGNNDLDDGGYYCRLEFQSFLIDTREHQSFYIELAICVMDWQLHAPQMRWLDEYRRVGGTTRVGKSSILRSLPAVVAISRLYEDDQSNTVERLAKVLMDWEHSETMWSVFMEKTLAQKIDQRCAELVLDFVLGVRQGTESHGAVNDDLPNCGAPFVCDEEEAVSPVDASHGIHSNREHVIETIEHAEPAAFRDPELLTAQAEHDWADQVVYLNQQEPIQVDDAHEENTESVRESIFLLEYRRCPESFLMALSESPALLSCRTALTESGFHWRLASGAKIFVRPWQFETAMTAMSETQITLRPFHVIVSQSLECEVETALSDLPCRQGARVRQRNLLTEAVAGWFPDDLGAGGAENDDVEVSAAPGEADASFEVKRTFICEVLRLRHPNSVTQSTTEALQHARNPRRMIAVSSTDS